MSKSLFFVYFLSKQSLGCSTPMAGTILKHCTTFYYHVAALLLFLLDPNDVDHALKGNIIDEEQVETRPEKVNPALADENVNFIRLRRYFSHDAWLLVEDVIKQLKLTNTWICQCCKEELLEDTQCIGCDECLYWFLFTRASLKKEPKSKYWFCRSCYGRL